MQLITPEYKRLNEQLHRDNSKYGANSMLWGEHLTHIISSLNIRTALDYGCGKGLLRFGLQDMVEDFQSYDPCVTDFSKRPDQAELVICTDVLEHVELECLDSVLMDIRDLTQRIVFFNISVVPAKKVLADGRNAHINLHPINWWIRKLSNYFELLEFSIFEIDDNRKDASKTEIKNIASGIYCLARLLT